MSKATCRIRQVERSTFDMSPVAVLRVDGRGDKSPVFGDKSKELNMIDSFDKSNIPATCRTRVSSVADVTLTTCRLRHVAFDLSLVIFPRVARRRYRRHAVSVSSALLYAAGPVPGWVTIFGRANHLGMQTSTQANSASYPTRNGK